MVVVKRCSSGGGGDAPVSQREREREREMSQGREERVSQPVERRVESGEPVGQSDDLLEGDGDLD